MRLDKFLWAVRVFKTRQLACEACKKNHVELDGKPLKPAKMLEGSETLVIWKNQTEVTIKIKAFPPSRVGAEKLEAYIEDLTPVPTSSYHKEQVSLKSKIKIKQYRDKEHKIPKQEKLKMMKAKFGLE